MAVTRRTVVRLATPRLAGCLGRPRILRPGRSPARTGVKADVKADLKADVIDLRGKLISVCWVGSPARCALCACAPRPPWGAPPPRGRSKSTPVCYDECVRCAARRRRPDGSPSASSSASVWPGLQAGHTARRSAQHTGGMAPHQAHVSPEGIRHVTRV